MQIPNAGGSGQEPGFWPLVKYDKLFEDIFKFKLTIDKNKDRDG